jgi:hypothetical protein
MVIVEQLVESRMAEKTEELGDGRENWRARRKPAPAPQIPHDQTQAQTRAAALV